MCERVFQIIDCAKAVRFPLAHFLHQRFHRLQCPSILLVAQFPAQQLLHGGIQRREDVHYVEEEEEVKVEAAGINRIKIYELEMK